MKIFFSWSKPISNSVAQSLKKFLTKIFGEKLECFISSEDIYSGEKWFEVICNEIDHSDLVIVCLTPENTYSKWLDFECGAIAFNSKKAPVCAFLFQLNEISTSHPLNQFQITKNIKEHIYKLVKTINNKGSFGFNDQQLSALFTPNYKKLSEELTRLDSQSSKSHTNSPSTEFFKNKIYPPNKIESTVKNRMFIGTPMASINSTQYKPIRDNIITLINTIKKHCNVTDIYSPVIKIKKANEFDGKEKAMEMDFTELKKSEYYIFIYPLKTPSSVLVEIGYAIALMKKTIIFVRSKKDLPFMLEEADKGNHNIKIYQYKNFAELNKLIETEGSAILNFKHYE